MRLSLLKSLALVILIVIASVNISWRYNKLSTNKQSAIPSSRLLTIESDSKSGYAAVYDDLQLGIKGLSKLAFDKAIDGFEKLEDEGLLKNDSVITIIDFDQPSYNKRMYVLDIKNERILFNTWVAHGKNSGAAMAQSFSNTPESNKSSLGFYITENTYIGSKGYSLKLKGLESTNSNALERAIVLHGAPYVSQSTIKAMGFIGRSHGCPAVSPQLSKPIIEEIKNGSCLFIYNKKYQSEAHFNI